MRINAKNIKTIVLQEGELEEVKEFTYLGSVMDRSGGTDKVIKVRIGKARAAFNTLKISFFNSNVKSVLVYGAETWRTTITSDKIIYK